MRNPIQAQAARALLCVAAAASLAAACSSDDDGAPPVTPPSTFNSFVLDQFAATADDTDPVPVNGLDFTFDEDPSAFDALLD